MPGRGALWYRGGMKPVRIHALPSTGLLLGLLAGVMALAWQLNPSPARHRANQIPGLTYEVRQNDRAHALFLVVTSVEDDGLAANADIEPGDVIDRIDGKPIASRSAVGEAVRRDHGGVLLHLRPHRATGDRRLPVDR